MELYGVHVQDARERGRWWYRHIHSFYQWSFGAVDKDTGCVTVTEKSVSDVAAVGFYYWAQGKDFVHYANQMIKNETKVNGEYYICAVFNEAIADNKMIVVKGFCYAWAGHAEI